MLEIDYTLMQYHIVIFQKNRLLKVRVILIDLTCKLSSRL